MDVTEWLLAGDPAIRWQALRDLGGASASQVALERARVAREGLGARLLAAQADDGSWHHPDEPSWFPTLHTLRLVLACGVDPADPTVAEATRRLGEGFRWHESLGGRGFFDGETEPCINGGALAIGAYLGRPSSSLLRLLLDGQLEDGGWNCEAPPSTRSSYHSTICVLEGLLAYERAVGATDETTRARRRGEAWLLERGMFRRRSTGEPAHPSFITLSFPTQWRYDVLRGLDHFRDAGLAPDARLADAIELLERKRRPDGTWPLDGAHTAGVPIAPDEVVGEPSRWNTLRALRVLRWARGR